MNRGIILGPMVERDLVVLEAGQCASQLSKQSPYSHGYIQIVLL